jgi:hypothetical protein
LLTTGEKNETLVGEMFVTTLSREPTSEEQAECIRLIEKAPDARRGLEDVMWALINSKEFIFRR